VARVTAFNRPIDEALFTKYSETIGKHKLNPELMYEVVKCGLSAFHNPPIVVAVKGGKQVGSVTSGEGGVTVITGYINALGNSIPSVLIFSHVHFKNHMSISAPPGTHGASCSSGWSYGAELLEFLDHFTYHVEPLESASTLRQSRQPHHSTSDLQMSRE
jgi:hypothetical protein